MRILVTGRHGQLARSLADVAKRKPELDMLFVGRPEIDLEIPGSIGEAIRASRPDLVINAAAYTEVDRAEQEADRAFRINAEAAGEAAAAAAEIGVPILQISTDYVFDGTAERPYREDDPVDPINVYGLSKLAGELAVRAANPRHLILRTSWIYSPFGRNFVANMLWLAGERDEIRVVADQIGSPTSALDLADATLAVIEGGHAATGDTLHFAGAGQASWAELAGEAMRGSASLGGPSADVVPISSEDWPTTARRPVNSVLDCSRFAASFGMPRPWRDSLGEVVARLLSADRAP